MLLMSCILSAYMTKQANKSSIHDDVARPDLYEFEIDESKKTNINITQTSNLKKIEVLDVETRYGKTKLIRWSKNHDKVVFFVHGILTDKYTAIKIVDQWDKQGYDVISFDGYGWGEWKDHTHSKFASKYNVNTTRDVLVFVLEHYNLKSVLLAGESMGGATVYKYLQMYGTKNISKVFVDSGYFSFQNNMMYSAKAVVKSVPMALLRISQLTLWIFLGIKGYPVKRQISKKTLRNLDVPLMHVQSRDDEMVFFDHTVKSSKYFNNKGMYRQYKTQGVRHVRGYYDSPKEIAELMSELVNK